MNIVTESFTPKQITASANVLATPGALAGIFCSSGSASVIVYDSADTTAANKIVESFTPIPGTFHPLPFELKNGCYVAITGTGAYTVAVRPQ